MASAAADGFSKEGSGLFALRVEVLADKKAQEPAYQAQRKAMQKVLDDEGNRLGAAVDTLEVQGVKQRQVLEAAMRVRSEPGDVVAASDAISLDMKAMTATLRLRMLAASPEEAQTSEASARWPNAWPAISTGCVPGCKKWASRNCWPMWLRRRWR